MMPATVTPLADDLAAMVVTELAPLLDRRDLEWQDQALCGQVDPDLWYPEKGESAREPKAVCRNCPVRAECLGYALEHDERFGLWGGMAERDRRKVEPLYAAGVTAEDIIAAADEQSARIARTAASRRNDREREARRLHQTRLMASASAEVRAARVEQEITEAQAAGEQQCTGPCGQVKALSEFGQRKDRRRNRVCKRCRTDAELRRRAELAAMVKALGGSPMEPATQPRKAVAL